MKWWSRSSARAKVASLVAAVGVLAIVGAVVGPQFNGTNTGDAEMVRSDQAARSDARPLDLGTVVKMGSDYKVAVTRVLLYKGDGDRFVVATIKAEYVGKEDGYPWADLVVKFAGATSSKTFGETGCPSDLDDVNNSNAPVLAIGDVRTYDICIEVSTTNIHGGRISVEEVSSSASKTYWSTNGAVTKTAPSPSPTTPTQEASSAAPRPAPRYNSDSSDSDTYDSDAVEEYRDKLDRAIERGERLRDRIKAQLAVWKKNGHDSDDIDDAEDYLKDLEDQIDDYKKERERIDRAVGD
jgi:hypothetical protein